MTTNYGATVYALSLKMGFSHVYELCGLLSIRAWETCVCCMGSVHAITENKTQLPLLVLYFMCQRTSLRAAGRGIPFPVMHIIYVNICTCEPVLLNWQNKIEGYKYLEQPLQICNKYLFCSTDKAHLLGQGQARTSS